MPDLGGVTKTLRQALQEVFEHAHPLDGKGRRKLQKEGPEPVTELGHGAQEFSGHGFGAHQVVFVGDLLGVLYTIHKLAHSYRRGREGMSIAPSSYREAAQGVPLQSLGYPLNMLTYREYCCVNVA